MGSIRVSGENFHLQQLKEGNQKPVCRTNIEKMAWIVVRVVAGLLAGGATAGEIVALCVLPGGLAAFLTVAYVLIALSIFRSLGAEGAEGADRVLLKKGASRGNFRIN